MTDRRILKTKKAIKNAFVMLMSEKDMNDITIKDIADQADINRKTFYHYYRGIYDVVDEIQNEIVSDFTKTMDSIDLISAIKSPSPIFENLMTVTSSDMDLYNTIVNTKYNHSFFEKIINMLKENIKQSILTQVEIEEYKLDVIVEYSVSGMIAVYKRWFQSDNKHNIEEISKLLSRICVNVAKLIFEDT